MDKPYKITDDLIEMATSGPHLRRLCLEAFGDDAPSRRTCGRIFLRHNKYKIVTPENEVIIIAPGEVSSPDTSRKKIQGRRFVLTSAQNNTAVNDNFFAALQNYCQKNDAMLIIGGITYTRPSGGIVFDENVRPYLLRESVELAKGLIWCGELNVSPTAVEPLSGLDSYTVGSSGIIPHTKVRMKSLPKVNGARPKFLFTTGSVTTRNYIPAKAGQKASFHHVYGALSVEVDAQGRWFARQLIADSTGGFYDLDTYYYPSGEIKKSNITAITWGDVHFPNESPLFWGWLDDMEQALKPEYHFLHDVYDFKARNHHQRDNPHALFQQGTKTVEGEFLNMERRLRMVSSKIDGEIVVVHGNHDAALDRWLREGDYRTDPLNAEFFLWCQLTLYRNVSFREGRMKAAFPMLIKSRGNVGDEIKFLDRDESFPLFRLTDKPVECGIHGHLGVNGSRGCPSQFTKIGRRVNTAHTHSAGIIDGVYTAGTSTELILSYSSGPSTWSHSHILTYQNSKRAIVTCCDEKWRAN